jgi:hypothetical protein
MNKRGMVCVRPNLLCAAAIAVVVFVAAATGEPVAPELPGEWIAQFHGVFFGSQCMHSGNMYYSDAAKMLRTDWVFEDRYASQCLYAGWWAKTDVNDCSGDACEIRNYFVPVNRTAYECTKIPLGAWWPRDYLSRARYVGSERLETGVVANVWNSSKLFLTGYVLSYTDAGDGVLLRMDVLQGPHEDYSVWFDKVFEVPDALDRRVFAPFPAELLQCD